jgi:hypothetical protein
MGVLSYISRTSQRDSKIPSAKYQNKDNNRFLKLRRNRGSNNFYSCKELLSNVIRSQSCFTLLSGYEENVINEEIAKPQPPIEPLPKSQPSNPSNGTISIYSTDGMENSIPRRTRAKTPVFAIGQLERKASGHSTDASRFLAEQYRAVLPLRAITPFLEAELPKPKLPRRKTLRKIKCQQSLRSINEEHSRSSSCSDSDTLVGSDSPTSEVSPLNWPKKQPPREADEAEHVMSAYQDLTDFTSSFDNDIGLKICMDLLTNELATKLFCQHPSELSDRASGLQILLMIEAYETVQQRLRQRMYKAHVLGERDDHVRAVNRILEHWLQVLYSVYDLSQERTKTKRVLEEECPLPISPGSETTATGDG